MKRFLSIVFLVTLMVLPMSLRTPWNLQESTPAKAKEIPMAETANLVTLGPDLARANWTHNHFANPSFEYWSDIWPEALSAGSSYERYHWYDYAHNTEGVRSAGFQCRTLDSSWSQAFYEQRYLNADATNLTLKFDWRLDQNFDPAIDHDYVYLYLEFTQGYRMFYFLNGSNSYTINTTYTGVFHLSGPEKQWILFDHNITADFLNLPNFPASIPTDLKLEEVEFFMRVYGGTKEYLRAFIDDVQLMNATHTFIGGSTRNGNFESHPVSGNWRTAGNSDPGLHSSSSNSHSGSRSLNLTTITTHYANYSYTNVGFASNVRLTSLNPANFSFWWRLEEITNLTNESLAFVELECYNSTEDWTTYYILSHGDMIPTLDYMNETWQTVFYAENFNMTDVWHHFSQDLLADIATRFLTNELFVNRITFRLETQNTPFCRIVLLVDDVSLNCAAVNGMGYEDQPAVGENVRGWDENEDYDEITVTDLAYAGSKAANLTVTTGDYVEAAQDPAFRPLNGTRETYFDFVWRLEEYSPGSLNYVRFEVSFGEDYAIDYLLAVSSSFPWTNTTSHKYLNVSSIGVTGTWVQCHIDLVNDFEAVFGITPDINISHCAFNGRCDSGGRIELLWDDFYLYDDPAPTLGNVVQNPLTPEYDDTVTVSADASDQDLHMVLVHYRVDAGSWQIATMTHQSGDTFQGTIPIQSYGTSVEYYVTANDTWGMTTTALDNGQYYTYSVGDSTNPVVTIDSPNDGAILTGIINITATVTDEGSGVAQVEITIEDIPVFTGTNEPFTYLWPSNLVYTGSYTIRVTAYDNAGNSATSSVTVSVQNPLPQLLLAAAIIIIIIVVIVVLFFLYRQGIILSKKPE
jgi:hypothetical protein